MPAQNVPPARKPNPAPTPRPAAPRQPVKLQSLAARGEVAPSSQNGHGAAHFLGRPIVLLVKTMDWKHDARDGEQAVSFDVRDVETGQIERLYTKSRALINDVMSGIVPISEEYDEVEVTIIEAGVSRSGNPIYGFDWGTEEGSAEYADKSF